MTFSEAVHNQMSKHLKKIRIKVDPRFAAHEHFKQCNGYEGYILDESDDVVQVMLIKQGSPVVSFPAEALLLQDPHYKLKMFFVKHLKLENVDSLYNDILNSETLDEIEAHLERLGIEGKQLAILYRKFICEEIPC